MSLEKALLNWFESPINDHGTPYVMCPLDFNIQEKNEFVDFANQKKFVSREEQINKLKEIIARRNP